MHKLETLKRKLASAEAKLDRLDKQIDSLTTEWNETERRISKLAYEVEIAEQLTTLFKP
jgi:peptidoglycan hydrolase CwlO-like protein